ncbi:MAG: hypothetical protein E6F98_08395 [Actinobacteria bacterium]|nr:MAG: hypothetical protein E6F98_08395 [Actinomycetota bacterium]
MDGARVGAQLLGNVEPWMPGGHEHVAEDALAVELEAPADAAHAIDPSISEAAVPTAAPAEPLDVREELADGRVKAVEERSHERRRRAACNRRPEGEPGEGRGEAVAVALGAHLALADRSGASAKRRRRVGVGAEDRDLVRLERAPQGLVRREPGEARAHDCHAHYFTEPASSPWTK